MSELEDELWFQWKVAKTRGKMTWNPPERQYRFDPDRKWLADFAWPAEMLLVEVDGGGYVYGRHNRPAGQEKDYEKHNAAVLAGWRVLRFTGSMVKSGEALKVIEEALAQ